MMKKDRFAHYLTGVPELDAEHWELFQLLERIRVLIDGGEESAATALFGYFFAELKHHTDKEERMMLESGYPYAKAHADQHPESTMKLMDLQRKLFGGEHVVMYVSVSDMVQLLSEHIDNGDIQFAKYYLSLDCNK